MTLLARESAKVQASEAVWLAIRKRRTTKAKIADTLGVSRARMTQLLNGYRNMTVETLGDIANALGCEVRIALVDRRPEVDATLKHHATQLESSP